MDLGVTVLIVDDHDQCRQSAARLLTFLGYDVIEAASEQEATRALAARPDGLTAVILDLCLGPDSDLGLARRLQSEHPAMPVLYVSGYSRDICEESDLLGPGRQFLEKPFALPQLARAMEELLSSAPVPLRRSRASAA